MTETKGVIMARPQRVRRVCSEPLNHRFAPVHSDVFTDKPLPDKGTMWQRVELTVDEYEVARLIDYENMTQQECAARMNISRTTVAEMYDKARYKIMDCIVNGKELDITGGNYHVCSGNQECVQKCNSCDCMK